MKVGTRKLRFKQMRFRTERHEYINEDENDLSLKVLEISLFIVLAKCKISNAELFT
jgi:hypothetical protein